MPTLHLGVIDIPYAQAPKKNQRRAGTAGTQTTGDVAGWIEGRYHVMEIFFEENKDQIVGYLEEGIAGSMESVLMGAANFSSLDPTGKAMSEIEDRFKQFLAMKEIESLGVPGIPTKAAERGVNHRLKRPYVRRAPRPSFIDTGLMQASFKAWLD